MDISLALSIGSTIGMSLIGYIVRGITDTIKSNKQAQDAVAERLRLAELALVRLEGLPKTIERDLEALREDLAEVKATLERWHEDLYRAKTSTSSSSMYAVRPQQSPTPPPPRPREPRRDR